MATIGTFSHTANGFSGSVKTLNLNVKTVTFSPADDDNEKGPDFRIFAGATEFGAAWKKTSREGRDYHSVKLDDPSFHGPIYASLVETDTEGDFSLMSAFESEERYIPTPTIAQALFCYRRRSFAPGGGAQRRARSASQHRHSL
ncbi:MAG: DUF736 domain-containing protein [Hyphomicrobiales bacterium]|nr:MAG: DUF736 domain-containing protein [Hyphomicrobiales bacterium]